MMELFMVPPHRALHALECRDYKPATSFLGGNITATKAQKIATGKLVYMYMYNPSTSYTDSTPSPPIAEDDLMW